MISKNVATCWVNLKRQNIGYTAIHTVRSGSLSAPDDYSTKNMQKYVKQLQSLTMITQLKLGITDGVSVGLVSTNVWRLAGDTLNITCNLLYHNHQVHRDFLITLYKGLLYAFFWVIPWHLNFICQSFGTLCSIFIGR
jgi:hypothetical protein